MPKLLTQERLEELLDYDQFTGVFKWKQHRRPQSPVGTVAGWWCKSTNSYRIEVDNVIYLAHRLAWFYVHGVWPSNQLDHKNRNPRNNWITNLREADNSENQANMPAKSNNSTGFRGVSKRGNSFVVQLYKRKDGKEIRIWRTFAIFEEACKFSEEKSKELHQNFSYHNNV